MPTNKNAQLRYQVLDRCFSDFNRRYDIEDLLEGSLRLKRIASARDMV